MRTQWPRIHRAGDHAEYTKILTALYELAGGGPMIDLGAGEAHVTWTWPESVLVDLVNRLNDRQIVDDIRNAPKRFSDRSFSMMLMSDSIEHLTEEDAVALIVGMVPLCRAQVIFTPVGPYHLQPDATHPDAHKSAWCPEQFWHDGWTVLEYPTFHRFEGGNILGAFWAWRFGWLSETPAVAEVLDKAGVELGVI